MASMLFKFVCSDDAREPDAPYHFFLPEGCVPRGVKFGGVVICPTLLTFWLTPLL